MRFLAGWATGLATGWAILALYRTLPLIDSMHCPDEPDGDPDISGGRT